MLTENDVKRLLDIANTGCIKGFVQEARTIYDGILAEYPDNIPAMLGDALSHTVVDDFEIAESKLISVLSKHPNDRDAQALMGLTLTLAGKKQEALKWLDSVKSGSDSAASLANGIWKSQNNIYR